VADPGCTRILVFAIFSIFSLSGFCSAHGSDEGFEHVAAPKSGRFSAIEVVVFGFRKRFFRNGRGASLGADWKSAIRGAGVA
jgi:hypothetical protein